MIQFKFLSGKTAGATWVARRLPVRVGRESTAHLRVVEEGVWDEHFTVRLKRGEGLLLHARPDARTEVNGQPVTVAALHNGDIISLGPVRLQFWLAQPVQRGLAWREWLIWIGMSLVCLCQIALIYWLRA